MFNAPRWAVRLLLIGVFVAFLWLIWRCLHDSTIRFLPENSLAAWILYPKPPDLLAHKVPPQGGEFATRFRRAFSLERSPENAVIEVRALESYGIEINGRPVVSTLDSFKDWKQVTKVNVTSFLRTGTNEIVVVVTNRAGPPLLSLGFVSTEVKLHSDRTWQASYAGAVWQPAQLASAPRAFKPGNPMRSETSLTTSLRRKAFAAVTLLLLSLVITLLLRRWAADSKQSLTESEITKVALSGLILLWALLFVHNVNQISPSNGFDTAHHVGYIQFIQQHHELPKSEQGWEMHQPPLYYLFAATLLRLFQWDAAAVEGLRALRYLSMLCGIGQILLVFASLRILFPKELRRPLAGATLAAFLPAHLYHSHYVTNEMFLALLVSGVFYLALRWLRSEARSCWLSAALGVCLGAALLTKLTAAIVAPIILLVLSAQIVAQRVAWKKSAVMFATFLGACLLVSGWYYWGLWKSGGPWNQSRWAYGLGWWQEDGYRTAAYYLRFGESLLRPLYGGFYSFWDGIYSTLWGDGLCGGSTSADFRPPWDYDLLALGYWLALLPTLAVLLGFALSLKKLLRDSALEWFLLVGATVLFALALIYFSLIAPGTSQVRASFGLMLLVPFCALFAAGFSFVSSLKHPIGIGVVTLFVFWNLNSFSAHWVSRDSPQPQLARAKLLLERGYFDQAAREAEEGLRRDPSKAILRSILSDCWNQMGRTNEAKRLIEQAVTQRPNDPMAHLDAGFEHARGGRFDEAIAETRLAVALAPDDPNAARQLVLLFASQHRFNEAEIACREALRISPYDPELHKWLKDLPQRELLPFGARE